MSRASNLAGFTTAISPPSNLNVGVLTAANFELGGTISFDSISATNNIAIGGTVAGVTTITGTGINQPLGINTLGQTEFKGAVEFNDNLSSVTIAGVTTLNSAGLIQSTGIGTFNQVNVGGVSTITSTGFNNPGGTSTFGDLKLRDGSDSSASIEMYPNVAGLGYQRIISFNRGTSQYETLSIGASSFELTEGSTSTRLKISPGGNVGLSSLQPKTDLDVSNRTGSIALPVGTTAQRPSTAYGGYIRWNSTSSALEVYNGTNWVEIISDYFPSGSTTLG